MKPVSEMTPYEIRVRCADIEGRSTKPTKLRFGGELVSVPRLVPDYCNDPNAINAAVLRLPLEKQRQWAFAMIEILEQRTPEPELGKAGAVLLLVTASALDRARAFVAIHEDGGEKPNPRRSDHLD